MLVNRRPSSISMIAVYQSKLVIVYQSCHPERSEGPGFSPMPPLSQARAITQVPRFARDDKRTITANSKSGMTPSNGKPGTTGAILSLRFRQLLAVRAGVGRLHHRDRLLQGKIQHSFRRQFDLLAFAGRLHRATSTGSRRSADRRTLASARDRSNNAAQDGAAPNLLGGILSA